VVILNMPKLLTRGYGGRLPQPPQPTMRPWWAQDQVKLQTMSWKLASIQLIQTIVIVIFSIGCLIELKILWGFTKFFCKQILKVSAFYLEKQKKVLFLKKNWAVVNIKTKKLCLPTQFSVKVLTMSCRLHVCVSKDFWNMWACVRHFCTLIIAKRLWFILFFWRHSIDNLFRLNNDNRSEYYGLCSSCLIGFFICYIFVSF
jgi:hypothetical protein